MARRIPGPKGSSGPPGPAGPSTVLTTLLWVDKGAAAGGTGSVGRPFNTVTDAVAAAPATCTIIVCDGDYSAELPIAWTDKFLTFIGFAVAEVSLPSVILPELQPNATAPLEIQLVGVRAAVNPSSQISVACENSVIVARGTSLSDYLLSGAPQGSSISSVGNAISGLTAYGATIGATTINGSLLLKGCVLTGALTLGLGATITETNLMGFALAFGSAHTLNIDVPSLKTAGALTNCTVALTDQEALNKFFYWDAQTSVPSSHQNGTLDAPFSILQSAIDACGATGGVILCAGVGDHTQDGLFDGAGVNNTLDFVSLRGNDPREPVRIGVLTIQNHCHVTAFGIQFDQIVGTNSRFWAMCCSCGPLQMQAGNLRMSTYQAATPLDTTPKWSVGNVDATDGGTVAFFGMKIAGNVFIGGASATTENCFQQCDMARAPGFSLFVANAGTVVYIDQFSMARARAQAYNIQGVNNLGTVILLDRPATSGLVFVVGVLLAGAIQDVAVALVGTRPGDTFDIAPNPAAMLANVTPIAAWCAVSDQITVRFLATTGGTVGGNYQVDVNVNANSGN